MQNCVRICKVPEVEAEDVEHPSEVQKRRRMKVQSEVNLEDLLVEFSTEKYCQKRARKTNFKDKINHNFSTPNNSFYFYTSFLLAKEIRKRLQSEKLNLNLYLFYWKNRPVIVVQEERLIRSRG